MRQSVLFSFVLLLFIACKRIDSDNIVLSSSNISYLIEMSDSAYNRKTSGALKGNSRYYSLFISQDSKTENLNVMVVISNDYAIKSVFDSHAKCIKRTFLGCQKKGEKIIVYNDDGIRNNQIIKHIKETLIRGCICDDLPEPPMSGFWDPKTQYFYIDSFGVHRRQSDVNNPQVVETDTLEELILF